MHITTRVIIITAVYLNKVETKASGEKYTQAAHEYDSILGGIR